MANDRNFQALQGFSFLPYIVNYKRLTAMGRDLLNILATVFAHLTTTIQKCHWNEKHIYHDKSKQSKVFVNIIAICEHAGFKAGICTKVVSGTNIARLMMNKVFSQTSYWAATSKLTNKKPPNWTKKPQIYQLKTSKLSVLSLSLDVIAVNNMDNIKTSNKVSKLGNLYFHTQKKNYIW